MARAETRNLVIATLAVHLNVSEQRVTEDANLFDDLGADSLDVVELTLQFEEMFHVEISDDDLEQMHNVGKVIDLIEEKVSTRMIEEQDAGSPPEDDPKLPEGQPVEDDAEAEGDGEDEGEGESPEEE